MLGATLLALFLTWGEQRPQPLPSAAGRASPEQREPGYRTWPCEEAGCSLCLSEELWNHPASLTLCRHCSLLSEYHVYFTK